MKSHRRFLLLCCMGMATSPLVQAGGESLARDRELEGTPPLTLQGDIAELMNAGVSRFLQREIEASVALRASHWQRDTSSAAVYPASVEANRTRFARMIGLRDARVKIDELELVATPSRPALVGRGQGFEIFSVRWPVFEGVYGEGFLLEPTGAPVRANLVVIPDCEQTAEASVGLLPGIPSVSQMARRLAESGCRVVVPTLINRDRELAVIPGSRPRPTMTNREFLYRAAYQMGRHLIGYEVHKILAVVDVFARGPAGLPIGVTGYGEGGMMALYAAAVDSRITVAGVSGYFDSRQAIWEEPIDRNVFGLLREFGDAEIASLIAPRALVVEACGAPTLIIPPGTNSAPGRLITPGIDSVRREIKRANDLVRGLDPRSGVELVESEAGRGPFGTLLFLQRLLARLGVDGPRVVDGSPPVKLKPQFDPVQRMARQFREMAMFSQRLVDGSLEERVKFSSKIDRSGDLEKFIQSAEPYRNYFRDEIIGAFDRQLDAPSPRTRLLYDEPEYHGYEVVLDIFPDVMFYGILLVPKDLKPGERRPLVVCQHGLRGRAEQTVVGDKTSYRDMAARLAKRGFITFSPQHLYHGGDFKTIQRKAYPLKQSLFSIMTAQHQQLLGWLGSLAFVDRDRIAFHGISYGGKSAMRIPALLKGYCLSICGSDFSDWIWRTATDKYPDGYLAHNEYEMFEFDLGSTFNYAEIAALICPRPFAVEDFYHDGVAADRCSAEYGRVALLYDNLGINDRTRRVHFGNYLSNKPYTERKVFDFLHEQLRWPQRSGAVENVSPPVPGTKKR